MILWLEIDVISLSISAFLWNSIVFEQKTHWENEVWIKAMVWWLREDLLKLPCMSWECKAQGLESSFHIDPVGKLILTKQLLWGPLAASNPLIFLPEFKMLLWLYSWKRNRFGPTHLPNVWGCARIYCMVKYFVNVYASIGKGLRLM